MLTYIVSRGGISDYFSPDLSHEEIARRYPTVMSSTRIGSTPARCATHLLRRGGPVEAGFLRYAYRPFDTRWLYWEAETKLLDRPRPEYNSHVFKGNLWLVLQNKARPDLSRTPLVISTYGDSNLMNGGISMFPYISVTTDSGPACRKWSAAPPKLSPAAQRYLDSLGAGVEDLFHHVLAVLHDPAYREANAGALRMEWPRIPLPGWPDGTATGGGRACGISRAGPGTGRSTGLRHARSRCHGRCASP